MTHLLLDPPVNPLSPRSKIEAWINRLEGLAREPQYSGKQPQDAIERALCEAHSWLMDDPAPSTSVMSAKAAE
jgi:hypothetical protein